MLILALVLTVTGITGLTWIIVNKILDDEGNENEL